MVYYRGTAAEPNASADATCSPAHVGICILTNDFEFLNHVDVRDHDVCRSADIGVDDTVEEVELGAVLLAVK